MPNLLIVDDEPDLRALLSRYLGTEGFHVEAVGDGPAMRAWMASHQVDLVVLDLMLPGEDGLSLARWLRQNNGPPIIVLSARGDEMDRIIGLEVGADDYLPKPFNPRELLARIRAVLRRGQGEKEDEREPVVMFGECCLDLERHQLTRSGKAVPLTAGEFELMRVFVQHSDRVLSRDRLLELTKGYERAPFDRSIDVRVTRLRRKIEIDPTNPIHLRTVWGAGYIFSIRG